MKYLFLTVFLLFSVSAIAQDASSMTLRAFPIVSKERAKKLHLYEADREVTKVVEGRLAFQGSNSNYIQDKPSYKCIVIDKTDRDHWKIELYAPDDADLSRAPRVSIYRTVCCADMVDNVLTVDIEATTPGPRWTKLGIVELDDKYIITFSGARDRWDGKIILKWICEKGNFPDPNASSSTDTNDSSSTDTDYDDDAEIIIEIEPQPIICTEG